MLTVIVIITHIWTLTTNSPSTLQALQSWCCDGLINIMTPILMCAGFQHSQFVAYWISFNAIECHNLLVLALDNPKYLWHIYDYDKFRLSVLNCSQDSGFHNYLRLGLLVPNLANPGRLRSCVQKLWGKKYSKNEMISHHFRKSATHQQVPQLPQERPASTFPFRWYLSSLSSLLLLLQSWPGEFCKHLPHHFCVHPYWSVLQ